MIDHRYRQCIVFTFYPDKEWSVGMFSWCSPVLLERYDKDRKKLEERKIEP